LAGALLRAPYFPWIAAVLAVLLTLPSLGVGWILDDYYHRAILLDRPRFRGLIGPPAAMFRFFQGDPALMRRLVDFGLFPWWSDPYLKGEFLQALTVLTHRLDYALWPNSPELMHAQNVFWLGTAVAAAAWFYRRMLGPTWIAGAAALLFALDDARGATVGFIANRNVLIAATLGISSLVLHDRWRRDGLRWAALLAPLLLAGALFAKEEGIGTCAYLGAYGLLADRAGRWRGCLALVPYVAVVVVWRMLRESWGYGVRYVGHYIDPLTDPGPFLSAAVWRWPVLLLGQWTPVPSDLPIVFQYGLGFAILLGLALAFLGLLFFALTPLLRRDAVARFWAAGMCFAVVPVCATFPMDRLLTFVGLGASGLLAQFWWFVFGGKAAPERTGALRRALAWFLIIAHAILAPLVLPFRAAHPLGPQWVEHRFSIQTPPDPSLEGKTLVIVNAPSTPHAHYMMLHWDLAGLPVPKTIRVLAPAVPGVTIRRLDDRTLAIRPREGYLRWVIDQVFRTGRHPLELGEQVRLTGLTVTITGLTADGRPAEASFRFDVPLESPSLVWLCFRRGRFEPFTPPVIGEQTKIDFDWGAMVWPPWSR
jgi:hypothetical protein